VFNAFAVDEDVAAWSEGWWVPARIVASDRRNGMFSVVLTAELDRDPEAMTTDELVEASLPQYRPQFIRPLREFGHV
jgi:hypothetical protein